MWVYSPRAVRANSEGENVSGSGPSNTKSRALRTPTMSIAESPTSTESAKLTADSVPTTPTVNGSSPYAHRYTASTDSIGDGVSITGGLSRTGSIYTLGRVSLQGQLSHLTSLKLPDASLLANRISSIPTSAEAAKALADASAQIRMWISKAQDVLRSLNAEDDVEWAAAGGREGIEDVDKAISRFDRLVEVYIVSIERLQRRDDAETLSPEELTASVSSMESIIATWQQVKDMLKGVKIQVEMAMQWEEIWNKTLGEIGLELDGLNRLVFEMEEKRHQGAEGVLSSKDSIDINELEIIVEERPGRRGGSKNTRFSMPPPPTDASMQPRPADENREESSLLALFARMQPVRASLDFLPMKLHAFHSCGNAIFPSACADLKERQDQFESQWTKLEADAESLRRELGEDRWVLVFRNAGRQALKMCESITRSFNKLRDSLESGEAESDESGLAAKRENFEAKRTHYGPAIERVLAIIDRGVTDRLTVNGEVLRVQSDMKRMWTGLETEMGQMDALLDELNEKKDKQLRDSVSTVVSSDRSRNSSLVDTPGSSPASSFVVISRKSSFQGSKTPTPLTNGKTRKGSQARASSVMPGSSLPRKVPLSQSVSRESRSPSLSPLTAHTVNIATKRQVDDPPPSNRPRFVSAVKSENRDFLPLSTLEPSPYAKSPVIKRTSYLRSSSIPTGQNIYTSSSRPPFNSRVVSTPSKLPLTPSTPLPKITVADGEKRKSSLPLPVSTTPPSNSAMSSKPLPATPVTPATPATPGPRRKSIAPVLNTRRSSSLLTVAVNQQGNRDIPSLPETPAATPVASRTNAGGAGGRRLSTLPTTTTSGGRRSNLPPTPLASSKKASEASPTLRRSKPSNGSLNASGVGHGRRNVTLPPRVDG